MRTTESTSGTTGKTRRAPVATTLAAFCLAVPMVAAFSGTAFADTDTTAAADHGNSAVAQAAAAVKKDAADSNGKALGHVDDAAVATVTVKPAGFIGPVIPADSTTSNANTTSVPFTNQGGVTTGSNTTKYEVVNGRSGSPAVGGGQPSGDVMKPQPLSNADSNNTGANDTSATNPYRSTRNGAPSLNGNGGGKAVGQPCAGCVGKADNKNPKGQAPNATDHNAGYECDRNHGIGRSNPAHTGCNTTITTCVPQAGQDANCNPIKKCVPTGNQDKDCNPPKCVPTAQQDKDCKTPGSACVPVGNQDSSCNPPKDCLGVVNGSATADMCKPPVTCPAAGTMGPVPAGCGVTGGGGGPATGPGTIVPNSNTPITPVAGTTPGPGTALPFTGSQTPLLLETSALLLLVGTGLMIATRKPKPAIALV